MNAAQRKLFDIVVQGVAESCAGLHDSATMVLALLLLTAIIGLAVFWVWVLRGGFSRYLSLETVETRRALERWLRES
jgi:hypothetical protein